MDSAERLSILYRAGDVQRFHTCNMVKRQNVAQHTYGALLWAMEICECLHLMPEERTAIYERLLIHDAPELEMGDVPANIKHDNPTIEAFYAAYERNFYRRLDLEPPFLGELGEAIVRACDLFDLCSTCVREKTMGNRSLRNAEIFKRACGYLVETTLHGNIELARLINEALDDLKGDWEHA